MLKTNTCINVYSEMNPFIDFCIIIGAYENLSKAEEIVQKAYDDWWELEDAYSMPIADYIGSKLKENDIEFDVYFKGDETENAIEDYVIARFEVGKTYTTGEIVIGNGTKYIVKDRTDNTVCIEERVAGIEGMDLYRSLKWYDIHIFNGTTEYVVLKESFGNEKRLYAR